MIVGFVLEALFEASMVQIRLWWKYVEQTLAAKSLFWFFKWTFLPSAVVWRERTMNFFVFIFLAAEKKPRSRLWTRVARWFVFKPKIQIWVNFGEPWNGKCCYILRPFGKSYGHLV
jgi:hypothetical protein